MGMRLLIKAIPYIIIALMATALTFQQIHISSLKKHRNEQSEIIQSQKNIIDDLIKRKTYAFDVKLSVTDRSTNKIYGRYNKGTIQMPNLKEYVLKIDSTNINIK